MNSGPVVLITGTSTGIGRAAAERLHQEGATVIATARNLDDIHDLAAGGIETMLLDVTNEEQMQAAVQEIIGKHGRIDALVNNAGYGVMYPQEEMPMEKMRQMFDVNVFGLQRMTQLVLPHMRAQGSGRIVNLASAAGHVSLPMMGAYCATKFSVRALSWALKGEVARFGIKVSLVEPGAIKTNFGQRSAAESQGSSASWVDSPYAAMHDNWDSIRMTDSGGDVSVISKRIVKAVLSRRPKFHYLAPYDAKGASFAARFFPDGLTSKAAQWYFWRKQK
jgi:NAD(P)-dependent dehydrogenase (short-subunit alcohol dehydrogenase family)